MAATCDVSAGRITLAVVNRDPERAHATTIQLADLAIASVDAYEVNGAGPNVINSFEQPQAVTVQEKKEISAGASTFEYRFPPHSVTILCMRIAR